MAVKKGDILQYQNAHLVMTTGKLYTAQTDEVNGRVGIEDDNGQPHQMLVRCFNLLPQEALSLPKLPDVRGIGWEIGCVRGRYVATHPDSIPYMLVRGKWEKL